MGSLAPVMSVVGFPRPASEPVNLPLFERRTVLACPVPIPLLVGCANPRMELRHELDLP